MFAESAVTGHLLRELRTAAGISLRTMAIRTAFGLVGVDVERLSATIADPAGAGTSSLEDIAVIL